MYVDSAVAQFPDAIKLSTGYFYIRPGAQNFLEFTMDYDIAIYTSLHMNIAIEIVNVLYEHTNKPPLFVEIVKDKNNDNLCARYPDCNITVIDSSLKHVHKLAQTHIIAPYEFGEFSRNDDVLDNLADYLALKR